MPVTAVEGGFIQSIEESNQIIRQIVEARNASREDQWPEVEEELKEALNIDNPQPLAVPEDSSENPKDAIGATKLPLHLWPTTASAMGCVAMLNGALKYGRSNWRKIGVRASIYYDACQRHLSAWFEGREVDEDGVPHLASALACFAIIVDAKAAGMLRDDRQVSGGHAELMQSLTPLVAHLKDLHEGKSPRHYTIKDSAQ